ncbi:hypothetical protein [Sedimentitalea nanhaiensis]|uniref:Uncharacterized protein n=1 Tax=Sedimentitalea nanhaiensis TaxID=999627 RepID=A0A1I6Y063_9RHOB|nr:hypothetical protein [Sedimentitalea nanhaiensis]SFT43611.1 hypothetical protein SAMN05216236_1021 [Sedimentitalea nanhaiensis]
MSIHDAKILKAAMQIVEESDNWGEATIELNGHHINLNDFFDQDMLSVLALHKPTLEKLNDLASQLSGILEDLREKPPMTDDMALRTVEAAKDKINEYVDLRFVTDIVRDEKGYLGFCYDPERFARMRN